MATCADPIPTETATPKIQHCAWCLAEGFDMKHCGQCNKRAYCSKECQAKDWSKEGQGHRKWCKLGSGEEDVDWVIRDIPGRGKGLVALRDFPRGTRIMVDRGYTAWEMKQNPERLANLEPAGGTWKEKFEYNQLDAKPLPLLCFHTFRALHSCNPNAAHWMDEEFLVDILYSRRKIKAGDEITVSYHDFRAMDHFVTPEVTRMALEQNCGIVCPPDCACRDEMEIAQVRQAQSLEMNYLRLARACKIKEAFEVAKKLLRLYDDMNIGIAALYNVSWYAYLFAIRHKSTVKEGVKILKNALAVYAKIFHPKSSEIVAMQASIENPQIHPDYLIGNNTEGLVFKDGPLAEFEPFEYVLQDYDASTGEDPTEYTIRKTHEIMQELGSGKVRALTTNPPDKIPHCSLCKKVCKIYDWKLMNGEAHQYWGKMECGEEDVDWVVEDKKVMAKRDFPHGSRIMVERGTPMAPILTALNGPKQGKTKPPVCCFDALKVGHSCSPNASFIYDNTSKVVIVFADRDIKAGEEVTMAYVPSFPPVDVTKILQQDFGITCPEGCVCRDPVRMQRIQEADEMDKAVLRLVKEGKFLEAFEMAKKLLDLYNIVDAEILLRNRTSIEAFLLGIRYESTFDEAVEICRWSFNLVSQFVPNNSPFVLAMGETLNNPSLDPWFKIGDRVDSDDEEFFRRTTEVTSWSLPRGFEGLSSETASPFRSMLQNMGMQI